MPKELNVPLNQAELSLVLQGLSGLPWISVNELIVKISNLAREAAAQPELPHVG